MSFFEATLLALETILFNKLNGWVILGQNKETLNISIDQGTLTEGEGSVQLTAMY
jgi:hypothetical protein